MFAYIGTGSNSVSVVEVDDNTGDLIKIVETIHPVAPNPDNLEEGTFNGIATEWVCRHPKFPILYVLTSYWSSRQAAITTFRINVKDGSLTKMGSCESGGLQAVIGEFSDDGSTLVVAHHNDGNLSVFDCSEDKALEKPLTVIETPELVPGSRRLLGPAQAGSPLPSIHHVIYSPNKKYLLTCDCAQDAVFTYPVDSNGRPTSSTPTYIHACKTESVVYGWFLRLIFVYILGNKNRPRRVAIHPSGKYAYVMYEVLNIIQVYSINEEGKMDTECMQEISTMDPDFTASFWKPVGLTFNLAAELYATEDSLFVSNRGDIFFGRAENTIRRFKILDGGARIQSKEALPVSGAVRHFILKDDKVIAGTLCTHSAFLESYQNTLTRTQCTHETILHTFQKKNKKDSAADDTYELVGQANINTGVYCVQIS